MTAPPPPPALSPRPPSAIDAVADAYVDAAIALSPLTATSLGIPGHERDLDDFSSDGHQAQAELRASTLSQLATLTPTDDVDKVTVATMRERLGVEQERYEAGIDESALDVIASPLQGIREVFDLMPTNATEDWATIAARMGTVPRALDQYLDTLVTSVDRGRVSARRQVLACIDQCDALVADDGYFASLLASASVTEGPLEGPARRDLEAAVSAAAAAYARAGERLKAQILPRAREQDAVGEADYRLHSRYFLGATIDLQETYAWGQEELARIGRDMSATAERIAPGAGIEAAIEQLDADPAYQVHGTEALRVWMQERADRAIADLGSTAFDIPDPVRTIEARIAPTATGGIYYTGPSDDFTRPGRMWWSVPKGETEFGTWRELTTVHHEGVPGHHLQVGQTIVRRDTLNRYRRMLAWSSGHGEGWALYAEQLMRELGYMEDPGNLMGLLDAQSLRAARVVLDIGIHCGFAAPAEVGGGRWTYEAAWAYLTAHAHQGEGQMRFELDRYLGWPGQAPSYKVGERVWLNLREQVRQREGIDFDAKAFHRRALDLGATGLDVLSAAVLGDL
ncbi:MAG: DUF885 domain-containing protein [Nostocoides sp.]